MIINKQKQIAIICPPKNGTHTIYKALDGKYGWSRAGFYHEYKAKKLHGFTYLMPYRDPVDRAVSLYKDIVGRELARSRRVQSADSIDLHQKITTLAPTFEEFVQLLLLPWRHPSDYLLMPQIWWLDMMEPDKVVPLRDMDKFLKACGAEEVTREHTTDDVESVVLTDELKLAIKYWDPFPVK